MRQQNRGDKIGGATLDCRTSRQPSCSPLLLRWGTRISCPCSVSCVACTGLYPFLCFPNGWARIVHDAYHSAQSPESDAGNLQLGFGGLQTLPRRLNHRECPLVHLPSHAPNPIPRDKTRTPFCPGTGRGRSSEVVAAAPQSASGVLRRFWRTMCFAPKISRAHG